MSILGNMSLNNQAPLTFIVVDLDAIIHNIRAIKSHAGPRTTLMAVVKANAYGHGAIPVSRAALFAGAERLAVARAGEGIALRKAGITVPILVLGYTMPGEVQAAVAHDLTLTVTETHLAQMISDTATAMHRTVTYHVKIDTGMGRFGLLPEEAVPFLQQIAALPSLQFEGLFTHFAVADSSDKAYTRQQFARYRQTLTAVESAGFHVTVRHVANSAATLSLPEMHLDAVRPGIAIYGLQPSDEYRSPVELQPALTLKSHVARVRSLPPGSSVSYGRTYIADKPITAALVPVGYGDGFHRMLSNRGQVLINGQRCPIIGRVCMDQFVVDVSHAGMVNVNDEVVLIGRQGHEQISAEEVATLIETINYEVVTALTARVPRFYHTKDAALQALLNQP